MNKQTKTVLKNSLPCILRTYKKSTYPTSKLLIGLLISITLYLGCALYFSSLTFLNSFVLATEKTFTLIILFYIMQELEPDMKQNYNLAIILTALAVALQNNANPLGMLLILFCARTLSRTSGFKASLIELAIILMMSIFLFLFSSNGYALICFFALSVDYYLDRQNKKEIPFVIAIGIIGILGFYRSIKYIAFIPRPNIILVIILVIGILIFALRISFIKKFYSANDMNLKALSPKRIKALNSIILLTLFIESFVYGNHIEFLGLWALVVGLSLPYIKDIKKLLKK